MHDNNPDSGHSLLFQQSVQIDINLAQIEHQQVEMATIAPNALQQRLDSSVTIDLLAFGDDTRAVKQAAHFHQINFCAGENESANRVSVSPIGIGA